ncbi:MAG: RNA-binding protein [Bacteroidetes bacterium]|nr:RNA-binding protein [Bacteroidota bacterium]
MYMKLFVAGLPYDLDDAELEEIFEKFGTVTSAKVAVDKETGKSRGFGFVDMPDRAEAKDAMDSLNEISLGKKPLVIKEAEERSGGAPGGASRGGGYQGGGGQGGSRGGGGGGFRDRGSNDRRGGGGGNFDRNRNRY